MSEAIDHLKRSISEGKHWYMALLEAIGLWQVKEEAYNGQHYRYLIGREAFDWLLLAQRLCDEAGDLIPEEEKIDLLLGKPPLRLSKGEFKALIGHVKYRAYLNYFYGVIVEQMLQLAVETEAQKEQIGRIRHEDPQESAFRRIYGSSEPELLGRFRAENGYAPGEIIMLTEFDEFTYWLFKYRLANCDSARVASDTKKALEFLAELQGDPMEF